MVEQDRLAIDLAIVHHVTGGHHGPGRGRVERHGGARRSRDGQCPIGDRAYPGVSEQRSAVDPECPDRGPDVLRLKQAEHVRRALDGRDHRARSQLPDARRLHAEGGSDGLEVGLGHDDGPEARVMAGQRQAELGGRDRPVRRPVADDRHNRGLGDGRIREG